MPNTAIQIEHLSKMYRLGVINNGTLWQDMQTFFALKFGKQDPHSKIDEDKYLGDKDHFWALKDVSFDVKQGDRVGIIGKNGAGKSTLLKILSRITTPTEGTIKIKGKIASLLEVGTGFHGELTGKENIYLNGAILGMKKRRIDEKLDSIIEFSGIEQYIDTPVKRYSSGMYVRLAFAVAAHLDSDILIADEVLAVGDAEFQNKALGKMRELSTGEGRTVLFVSHNMAAVKKLCNQGIVLEKGKITSIGDIIESISFYANSSSGNSSSPLIDSDTNQGRYFEIDGSIPFQAEKIEISDKSGKQQTFYQAQEDIMIKLYCISRAPVPNMYGYLKIQNTNGEPYIICDSREDGKDILNNLAENRYKISLIIPGGILPFGDYLITLLFGSGNYDDFYIQKLDDVLQFRVEDTHSVRGNTRNALTSLLVDWNIDN
jgi:lipopolysaccharide transport system ATP-binding protein